MATSFIMNAQAIVSREIDLLEETVVLTSGKIKGGELANSVCGYVYLDAGYRAFTKESVEFIKKDSPIMPGRLQAYMGEKLI